MASRTGLFLCVIYSLFLGFAISLVSAAPLPLHPMTSGQKITENRFNEGRSCMRWCMFVNTTDIANQPAANDASQSTAPVPIPDEVDTPSVNDSDDDTSATDDPTITPSSSSESEITPNSSTTSQPDVVTEQHSNPPSEQSDSDTSSSDADLTPVVESNDSRPSTTVNAAFRSQTVSITLSLMVAGTSLFLLL